MQLTSLFVSFTIQLKFWMFFICFSSINSRTFCKAIKVSTTKALDRAHCFLHANKYDLNIFFKTSFYLDALEMNKSAQSTESKFDGVAVVLLGLLWPPSSSIIRSAPYHYNIAFSSDLPELENKSNLTCKISLQIDRATDGKTDTYCDRWNLVTPYKKVLLK